jgi:uncharacterized protein HemY
LPALRRARVPIRWTDLTNGCSDHLDRAVRARKLDSDAKILTEELAERPDDPFVLFNLGTIAGERGQWREALGYLEKSLAGAAPTASIVPRLRDLIGHARQVLADPGDPSRAQATLKAGASLA